MYQLRLLPTLSQVPVDLTQEPARAELRHLAHRISAGFPSPATDYSEEGLDLNEYLVRNQPALDRPITFPVFEPSPQQRENMLALLDLIGSPSTFGFERVELNRELGRFDEARQNLSSNLEGDSPNLYKLSATLIQQKQAAPVRYTP